MYLFKSLVFLLSFSVIKASSTTTPGPGSGIGGVTWFIASDTVKDSEGCKEEASVDGLVKHMTKRGERPGAVRSLQEEGRGKPGEVVNICIQRYPHWIFRPGKVELLWIPDNSEFQKKGNDEKMDEVKEKFGVKTEL